MNFNATFSEKPSDEYEPCASAGLACPVRDSSMITAASSIPVVASGVTMLVSAIVVRQTQLDDAFCAVGALLAATIALIDARKKDKSLGHSISVFIASTFLGMSIPGLAYHFALWKKWMDPLDYTVWQLWGLGGFLVGLLGWSAVEAFKRVGKWWIKQKEGEYSPPAERKMPRDSDMTPPTGSSGMTKP